MTIHIETPRDAEHLRAWAEILFRVEALRFGVDELRHSFEEDPASLWALAYLDGEAAGVGVGRPSSVAGSHYAMARVLPEKRRRGVGTALLGAIAEHAHAAGRTELWGRIRVDDDESCAFAEHRGFREVSREREVVLDLTRAPVTSPEPPAGIELVSLAERADLIPAVYAVDDEVSRDVPSHGEHQQHTFEHWRRSNFEGPGAMLEACFAALEGDEVVGYTAVRRRGAAEPEAENLLTAVRRQWRGRGIATALKQAQAQRAREAGVERIFTTNDETNAAMRGVNARVGFEAQPEYAIFSGAA